MRRGRTHLDFELTCISSQKWESDLGLMPLGGACDLHLDLAALSEAEEKHCRGEGAFVGEWVCVCVCVCVCVFPTLQALWGGSVKRPKGAWGPNIVMQSSFCQFPLFSPVLERVQKTDTNKSMKFKKKIWNLKISWQTVYVFRNDEMTLSCVY